MPDHQPQSQPHRPASAVSPSQLGATLVPCTYITVRCSQCGDLRLALAQLPSSSVIRCPQCAAACQFVLLATGFTRRRLPFLEIPRVPTKLLARRDEMPSCDPPTLNLSG